MRKERKKEHIEQYLRTLCEGNNLLGDVYLPYNALPDLNFDEIDISMNFLGKTIDAPIIINAMTGGTDWTKEINSSLATLAEKFNIPMAVGSQTIVLSGDEEAVSSFSVVREHVKDGVVISNLNANASVEDVLKAMEVIDADAIQLHLNPGQEMVMMEGDRDFKGILSNIENIVKEVDKPIIVKEVGLGISKEVGQKLYDAGVDYIDVSGSGGTNFLEIENLRYDKMDMSEFYYWGVPTALSLLDCRDISDDIKLISSGGIKDSFDIAKSLILGAETVAIAGEVLNYLIHGGYEAAEKYLYDLIYKFKMILLLLGKRNLTELREVDYKITGKLKELYEG